jgi:lipopolysaccharide export system protein LptA
MIKKKKIYKLAVGFLCVFLIESICLICLDTEKVFATDLQPILEADDIKTDFDLNVKIAKGNVKLIIELGQIEADNLQLNTQSGIAEAMGKVKVVLETGTVLQSNNLTCNIITKEVQLDGGVQLIGRDGLKVTATQLRYNGNTGMIDTVGEVRINNVLGICETEILEYNVLTATGFTGPVRITVNAPKRNIRVTGESMEVTNNTFKIEKGKITRSEAENPEYQLVTKELTFDGKFLSLKSIVIFIKGVPLFYYPALSLNIDNFNLPIIDPRYNNRGDLSIKYRSSGPINDDFDWNLKVLFRNHDYSSLEPGVTYRNGSISDYIGLYYKTESMGYGIKEHFTYNWSHITADIDGLKDFSRNRAYQLGFAVTRKYWSSPVGRWRFGVLGRKIYELDDKDTEFGGVYGGYRLDYNPHPYVTLSLLRLISFEGGDYRNYLDSYKIGSNIMYGLTIPMQKKYSLGLNGTYNCEQSLWIHQIYQINYKTDSLFIKFGWDEAKKAPVFGTLIKF